MAKLSRPPFIQQLHKQFAASPLDTGWKVGGRNTLRASFRPFSEYLLKCKLPQTRAGKNFGPLMVEVKADKADENRLTMMLVFSEGSKEEWESHNLGWCFTSLAQILVRRASSDTAFANVVRNKTKCPIQPERIIQSWHFSCSPDTFSQEVKACEQIIRILVPVVKEWFAMENPRHPKPF